MQTGLHTKGQADIQFWQGIVSVVYKESYFEQVQYVNPTESSLDHSDPIVILIRRFERCFTYYKMFGWKVVTAANFPSLLTFFCLNFVSLGYT